MAKIPDIGDTARPTPRPSRGVATMDTSGFERAGAIYAQDAARTGQGVGGVLDTIGRISESIRTTEARAQARQEVIDRIGVVNGFRQRLADGITALEDAGTIADRNQVRAYGQEVDGLFEQSIGSWQGSEEGRLMLEQELAQARFEHSSAVATKSLAAGKARVTNYLGTVLSSNAANIVQNPGMLAQSLQQIEAESMKVAPAMSEGEMTDWKRMATSLLVEQAATGMLQKGTPESISQVQELLMDPTLTRSIDAKTISAISGRMFMTQQAVVKAQADAMKLDLTEYYDSARGENVLGTKAEAYGKPAPKRSPLVSIQNMGDNEFMKQLGKNDADRVDAIFTDMSRAERDLDEIDRMRAAMESGNFETGFAGNTRANIARALELFGVSGEEVSSLIGDAATADTMEAAASRLAVQQAQDGGRLTNMFLATVRESLPALTRTPDGNAILLDVMERVAKRQIELGELADRYTQEHGTLRPKEGMTFYQEVRRLEEADPVISPELRAKISEASKAAPKSWKEILGEAESKVTGEPKAPEDYTFVKSVGGYDYFEGPAGIIRRKSE